MGAFLYKVGETMSRKERFTKFCCAGIEFTLCSFLGWLYEILLNLFMYGYYADRGVLHLPLCVIYGFGGIALRILFRRDPDWRIVFLGSTVIPTILELLTYEPLRSLAGYSLWDYSAWWWNYRGIISLPSSLIFGVMGLLLIKGLHPLLCKLQKKAPAWLIQGLGMLCILMILADALLYCRELCA